MRICMVCPSYPPQDITCGVGDYTRCLVEELVQQGEEVLLVASDGYRGHPSGATRVVAKEASWTFGTAWRLSATLGCSSADLLHVQYTPDLYGPGLGFKLFPLLARFRRNGQPIVVTMHSLVGGSLRTKVAALLLLATAHHTVSANEEVSALLRRYRPIPRSRWTEIPIGANIAVTDVRDTPDRDAERAALGLPQHATLLAHFGLVYPGKGIETLIQALPAVLRAVPDVRLVMIGDTRTPEQDYQNRLQALAARLNVSAAVLWAGRRTNEDVSRILRISDLYVVPYDGGASIRRGSLMAGLAHGLPIVSTYSAVPSAYLRDGVNVSLVAPRDPGLLGARVIALLNSRQETARVAGGALDLAKEFSWSRIARDTKGLYDRVVRQ